MRNSTCRGEEHSLPGSHMCVHVISTYFLFPFLSPLSTMVRVLLKFISGYKHWKGIAVGLEKGWNYSEILDLETFAVTGKPLGCFPPGKEGGGFNKTRNRGIMLR